MTGPMPHGYMRHPPVRRVPRVTSKKRLEDTSWDVHDLCAHSEEDLVGVWCFVKKSARLSMVRTYGTTICPSERQLVNVCGVHTVGDRPSLGDGRRKEFPGISSPLLIHHFMQVIGNLIFN